MAVLELRYQSPDPSTPITLSPYGQYSCFTISKPIFRSCKTVPTSLTNKLESFLFHNRDREEVKMDDYRDYFIVGNSLFRSSNSDDAIKKSLINPTRESIILE
ncbi:hypothetical protein V1477_020321 [Vespula maculifrons]|uniref:Uncharacterized protein n=1 Tax=Vespula maculifrons TaxID=7453 RepID=A0ABD2ALK6_VESMC